MHGGWMNLAEIQNFWSGMTFLATGFTFDHWPRLSLTMIWLSLTMLPEPLEKWTCWQTQSTVILGLMANLNYLLQTCRSHLGSKARGAANFRKCLSMKHVGWNKCKVDMRRCSCWKWKKCPNHQPVYMLSRVFGESTQHSWVPGHVRSQPITWQQQLGMMINLDSYGLTHL